MMDNEMKQRIEKMWKALQGIDQQVKKFIVDIALANSKDSDQIYVKTGFSENFENYKIELTSKRSKKFSKYELTLDELLIKGSENKLTQLLDFNVKEMIKEILK